jgi:enoyl-CoA hydratase
MNRPELGNAQNSAMTYALDEAFSRAAADDDVRVVVLGGAGKHFSSGHDIGSPGRDVDTSFDRVATLWWDHTTAEGVEVQLAREHEVYLGMCRRWRELPKPTVAMVQGACIAGGLMLAWACDLIVAGDDAYFADPTVRMGVPGVEYFAHPWQLGPRFAKELLFVGRRFDAARAQELGMVNRVVPRADLEAETLELAAGIAEMPRLALALAKEAVNRAEDRMGLRDGIDLAFGLHQLAHAHNVQTSADTIGGESPRRIKETLAPDPDS